MEQFLIAIAVLCGISAALTLLILVADRFLNDYGTCRIDINGGNRVIEVKGGETLLSALGSEKIFIPSACGGRGSCGLCKLKVLSGAGPILPTEEPHLSPDERRQGVRLSCQVKIRGDLAIEIPEALFAIREYQARVEKLETLTYDIKLLRLALIEPATIQIVPGQYVQLEAPPYEGSPESVYRAYSVATDPADTTHVDLIIRLVPKGLCTTWVFNHLRVGQTVKLNGPYGDFRLHDGGDMIFIAGGSGMAPFCSILAEMKRQRSPRRTRYFFGAKAVRDLFYLEEMKAFEKALPDFQFIPALSAPDPGDAWAGETGLITQVVDRHYQDCRDHQAYLCGSPGMIDACIKVLTAHGMPEANIHYDKFA